jgi:hypothetical protein
VRQEVFSFELPEMIISGFSHVSFIEGKVNWLNGQGYRVVSVIHLGSTFVFVVDRENTEEEI